MGTYRLYCLDGVGKVATAEWIEAHDDQTALDMVHELMDGMPAELWAGDRLIARLARKHSS